MKASERSEILRSVKGSCPLARDPRRRGRLVRNSHSLRTGRFLEAAGSHRVLPSHSTCPPRRTPTEVPKRGSRPDFIPPFLCESKSSGAPSSPRGIPHSIHAGGANRPALARQPACTGDNDDRVRRLRRGHEDSGRTSLRTGAQRRSPFWVQRRTGPQWGPVLLSSFSGPEPSGSEPVTLPSRRHRHSPEWS
jgi:hypothetical protein